MRFSNMYTNKYRPAHHSILGFTLIETLVAVGIFSIIMVTALGSLVITNNNHKVARNIKLLIDNVNFSMEDMSRSIRVGSNIYCESVYYSYFYDDVLPEVIYEVGEFGDLPPQSCSNISATSSSGFILFESFDGDPADSSDQHGYAIFTADDGKMGRLYKTIDNGSTWTAMTPPDVNIDYELSGFTVHGAEEGDGLQPYVIIRLHGDVYYKDEATSFSTQTGASLRYIVE